MLLTTFVFELLICPLHGSPEFANGMMQTPFKLAAATIQVPMLLTYTQAYYVDDRFRCEFIRIGLFKILR